MFQLVSVERVKAYGELNSEAELTSPQDRVPHAEWPNKGIIKLQNTKFKYAPSYPYVLKSISFEIDSSEKVNMELYMLTYTYINILDRCCG